MELYIYVCIKRNINSNSLKYGYNYALFLFSEMPCYYTTGINKDDKYNNFEITKTNYSIL